jgi:hypothetical protein
VAASSVPKTILIPVTGCNSAKFGACGLCECGRSKKPCSGMSGEDRIELRVTVHELEAIERALRVA